MKLIQKDNVDVFLADDIYDEYEKERMPEYEKEISLPFLEMFLENYPEHIEMIRLYSEAKDLQRTAFLDAHGFYEGDSWFYTDNGNYGEVQKWINEHDGKYAALVLAVCNPQQTEIHSRKSLVIAPNHDYGRLSFSPSGGQLEIYMPGKGYLSSYVFDYEMKMLREKILQKQLQAK